jgi:type 2 lantibiotic biosynthesis protein LanM
MTPPSPDFKLIAARARTWDERVAEGSIPDQPLATTASLEPWKSAVASADATAFARRLSWDGWTPETARRIVAAPPSSTDSPLPDWAIFLAEAVSGCAETLADLRADRFPSELQSVAPDRIPRFAELWLPFLRAARARLAARAGVRLERFAPAATRALDTWLLGEMGRQAESTLYGLFDLFRQEQFPAAGPPDGEIRTGCELYKVFVGSLLEGGLLPLFLEFSVLARLLSSLALMWVEFAAELAHRLSADSDAIARTFGATGAVAELAPGLGDRHRGGRCVTLLAFASGVRLVYKPRTMSAESAWNDVLGWMASRGVPVPPPLTVLDRDGYGWASFLDEAELPSAEAVETYFRNAGGLLCATWLGGARDLHMDNVVAGSLGPVVVDGELAFQPIVAGEVSSGNRTAFSRLGERLRESFVPTGLLSLEQSFPDGRREEVGGLSGEGGYPSSAPARFFVGANTDEMTIEERTGEVPPARNLPLSGGHRLKAADQAAAVRAGFEAAYRFLLDRREEILAPGGPLEAATRAETRLVFRRSDQYVRLLHVLGSPRYLREGHLRSWAIDALNRPLVASVDRPSLWPLVADERASLENLDVPYFTVGVGSRVSLTAKNEVVEGHILVSGLDAVRGCLERMGEEDLRSQLEILEALLSPVRRWEAAAEEPEAAALSTAGEEIRADTFIRKAAEIGERLLSRAIAGDDGSITWLAPEFVKGAGRRERGTAYYLYHGAAGIALFLAALSKATARPEFAEAARAVCHPIRRVLAAPDAALLLQEEGLGVTSGLGSVLWALTQLDELLPEDRFLGSAVRLADHITPERIAADSLLDLEGGAAGAILGLLSLHEATGEPAHRRSAEECGEHLLAHARDFGQAGWGWPAGDGLCQAGLAHGASGIALALGRLFAATGRDDFRDAALRAIRFVRGRLDPVRKNWPALAPDGPGERRIYMTAWCHGAPGVGLAHLELSRIPGLEEADDVAETAIETTAAAGVLSVDHLCCGNAGLVEALLVFGRARRRDDLLAAARKRMAALLAGAAERGFRLRGSQPREASSSPGLFRGETGIGYTLLRLADPETLPSVLAFRSGEAATRDRTERRGPVPVLRADSGLPTRDEILPGIRIEELAPPVDPRFLEMTFPAYRHLLQRRKARRHLDDLSLPEVTPWALGAIQGREPAGLVLAEILDPPADTVEILSLFVYPPRRGKGLGTRLLEDAAVRLARAGVSRLHGVYMTGQPTQEALERVLEKARWEPPRTRMLTIRFTLEEARRTEWYGRYPLGDGFTVFPWAELDSTEREALVKSQEERHWIKPDLEPWRHDRFGFEPLSSLGVRYRGELVGWVINHALSEKVVRFTCSFIRRDLGRRGKLVPAYSESIRRLSSTSFEECMLTVPLQHEGMARFLVRWCRPMASFFGETRGTQKRLRPTGEAEAPDPVDDPSRRC